MTAIATSEQEALAIGRYGLKRAPAELRRRGLLPRIAGGMPAPSGGHWAGSVGASGYLLCDYNGSSFAGIPDANDVVSLPAGMTYSSTGSTFLFGTTTEPTGSKWLENAAATSASGGSWFAGAAFTVTFTMDATHSFTGTLSIYQCDYDGGGRAQIVSDPTHSGAGATTIAAGATFQNGVWIQWSETIAAGSSLTITFTPNGGPSQALVSGFFFDASGGGGAAITGTAGATGSASGTPTVVGDLSGSASGSGATAGSPKAGASLGGSAAAAGATTGTPHATALVTGWLMVTSADLLGQPAVPGTGAIAGTAGAAGGVTGTPTVPGVLSGSVSGAGGAAGTPAVLAALSGAATGVGSSSGAPTVNAKMLGSAAAVGTLAGSPTVKAILTGSTAAAGVASGVPLAGAMTAAGMGASGGMTGQPATVGVARPFLGVFTGVAASMPVSGPSG